MNEEQYDLIVDIYKQFFMKPAEPVQQVNPVTTSDYVHTTIGVRLGQLSLNLWERNSLETEKVQILPPIMEEELSKPIIDEEAFIK